jgi:hypothetical protein
MNFSSPRILESHLRDRHSGRYTAAQEPHLIQRCEFPFDRFLASACPLCTDWTLHPAPDAEEGAPVYATVAQFRRHLGRHLEQLALFSLPKMDPREDESVENDSNNAMVDEESEGDEDLGDNEGSEDDEDLEDNELSEDEKSPRDNDARLEDQIPEGYGDFQGLPAFERNEGPGGGDGAERPVLGNIHITPSGNSFPIDGLWGDNSEFPCAGRVQF